MTFGAMQPRLGSTGICRTGIDQRQKAKVATLRLLGYWFPRSTNSYQTGKFTLSTALGYCSWPEPRKKLYGKRRLRSPFLPLCTAFRLLQRRSIFRELFLARSESSPTKRVYTLSRDCDS
jgi:hypothetical protein